MKDFPVEMQGDIAMHLHREILALPIFENASQGCLKAIAMQIKPMFCAPGEYIMHKGDVITSICCVCSGSMEILKDGMVVAITGWSGLDELRCYKNYETVFGVKRFFYEATSK